MRALVSAQLKGVWAAVPTPWTVNYELDTGVLEENIQRYQGWAVPGVYTTDSDGEFYALDLDEFRQLARAFGRAMERTSMDGAMGVTWCNTRGIIERIKISLDAGIPNVHVGFPFWMPLANSDVPRFFEDLATAVPESRWIHYRTDRGHILPTGVEYAHYHKTYPEQLVGTKLGTTDFVDLVEVIAHSPGLAHFAFELTEVMGALAGARGNYSYWVNTLPKWTLETWELCGRVCWEEAMIRQAKLIRWEKEFLQPLFQCGHNHGIIGKARVSLSDLVADNGLTRAPYYPVDSALVKQLKQQFQSFWSEEIAEELAQRTSLPLSATGEAQQ